MAYIGQEPGQGQAERFIFTATGVTDTVTADDDGRTIGYTVGQVSVYLNGVKQVIGADIETPMNGSTVVFDSNFAIGDVIEVIALSAFSPSDTVSASTGGTFAGNVVMSGNLTVNGTETIINTQTLTVEDKNIEMAKIGTPTDANADGGGITLKGNATAPFTDKTILWENDTNQWNVNQKWTENAGSSAWHRPLTTMLGLG